MDIKNLERLELNKILTACSSFACLSKTQQKICEILPSTDLAEVRKRLSLTKECYELLYSNGAPNVLFFDDVSQLLVMAKKGSTLSCGDLLCVNELLVSARSLFLSINGVANPNVVILKEMTNRIFFDERLEQDITQKIISVDTLSDYASDKLYAIRSKIKSLNERIRMALGEYATGKGSEFMQDNIVTMRNDRYVIPVRAEYKNRVKGFVHDRSQSGATFFIEPEDILEMNNELISLQIDERQEVERILSELSKRIGASCDNLLQSIEVISDIECYYAFAHYSFSHKCSCPLVNKNGVIDIIKGRHPLIDKTKVVPVSLQLGKNYNFMLLSGANTGGKTVTLKMVGLFCLMAACGIFIPANEGSIVSVFNNVFCDVGDSQSIEESLSTFSSHLKNVIDICDNVDNSSLVLIDELGGGTNPDEGQAIARAIVEHFLAVGCKGIITTHFTPLKEFAIEQEGIENASMEFDSNTLNPLYSIKIGLPGASNALAISKRLGLSEDILERALGYLSEGSRSFEHILSVAENSRVEAQEQLNRAQTLAREYQEKLNDLNKRIEQLEKEKERLRVTARAESRRIIAEKTQQAEEILEEIEGIFRKEEITEADLIRARTLKNKLKNTAFDEEERVEKVTNYVQADKFNVKVGIKVFVKKMQTEGEVVSLNKNKGEALVLVGTMNMHIAFSDLMIIGEKPKNKPKAVTVRRASPSASDRPMLEINLIGMNVEEALYELDNFIDQAVMSNLEEIKVVHGVGKGILKNAIAAHLRRHKNVLSFRLGKYGEGETGVTIITLK